MNLAILVNLETLETRLFFAKSQGKPGIVGEFSVIFILVRENSGKTNYLLHTSFHKLLHGNLQSSCSICCQ